MSEATASSLAHFAFMLLPNFTLIAFSSAIDVLRMANQVTGKCLYTWSLISPGGEAVTSSNGISISTVCASSTERPDIVIVCGGVDVQNATSSGHLAILRRFARIGTVLGSVCTGTYALARADLLAGYTCAIHWENLVSLSMEHPDTRFSHELFVIDSDRVTCTGGVAPVDMMLYLISRRLGTTLVTQIAEQFIVARVRDASAQQRIPLIARLGSANQCLLDAIALMESHIEEPLTLEDLARIMSKSERQMQRIFREYVGLTPTQYYMSLRLRRAKELLLQTNMSMIEITVACGFQSACHFSKTYRDAFGRPPTWERRKQSAPFAALASESCSCVLEH
ncbi:GlxA family transcriptional regulator [Caballeronia sp. DA-9]|uniref:GlxA family transcriptional regulator n=1 Tax=Caballeronia sp. DA-9 TaxID=3436237 RepID=UPI003F6623B6